MFTDNQSGSTQTTPTPATQSSTSALDQDNTSNSQGLGSDPIADQDHGDSDRIAFDLLSEGKIAGDVRKELSGDATPGDDEDEQGEYVQTEDDAAKNEAKAPAKAAALDDKTRQQLQQAGMLPDESIWDELPESARTAMVMAAQNIIAEKTRLFQQKQAIERDRDENGKFKKPEKETQEMGKPKGADGSAAKADDVLSQTLKSLRENYGEEIADPIQKAFEAVMGQHAESLSQRDKQLEQIQQLQEYVVRRHVEADEKSAREELSKDVPEINEETFSSIKEHAKVLAQAAVNANANWSWRDCLVQAGRTFLQPTIRQQEQAKLAAQRKNSLKATPSIVGRETPPQTPLTPEERDKAAFDLLSRGKTPAEARSAVLR